MSRWLSCWSRDVRRRRQKDAVKVAPHLLKTLLITFAEIYLTSVKLLSVRNHNNHTYNRPCKFRVCSLVEVIVNFWNYSFSKFSLQPRCTGVMSYVEFFNCFSSAGLLNVHIFLELEDVMIVFSGGDVSGIVAGGKFWPRVSSRFVFKFVLLSWSNSTGSKFRHFRLIKLPIQDAGRVVGSLKLLLLFWKNDVWDLDGCITVCS